MPRAGRWQISHSERALLDDTLVRTDTPDVEERSSLAVLMGRTPRQVQVYFQNKRQRTTPPAHVASPVAALPVELVSLAVVNHSTLPEVGAEGAVHLAAAAFECSGGSARLLADAAVGSQVVSDTARLMARDPALSPSDAEAVALYAMLARIVRCYA